MKTVPEPETVEVAIGPSGTKVNPVKTVVVRLSVVADTKLVITLSLSTTVLTGLVVTVMVETSVKVNRTASRVLVEAKIEEETVDSETLRVVMRDGAVGKDVIVVIAVKEKMSVTVNVIGCVFVVTVTIYIF